MVDDYLPIENLAVRRLSTLFVDINAYFASVEQEERPELRGKPVAVAAVNTDSGTIIAASYEAKPFGVKTGTRVGDAREMCPGLIIVDGRHTTYARYHQRIIEAVESVLPVDKICSIDEMRCRLIGNEREPERAKELGMRVKQAIRDKVGGTIRCSVGVATNNFLAKLATDMQKPDGLVIILPEELPHKLFGLELTDFAGINRRMEARINAAGIFTVREMCLASRSELRAAFGSVIGERWWYLLRGYDLEDRETHTKTLGHSHVLPPHLRTDQGCRDVLLRLTHKACARMRSQGLSSGSASIYVHGKMKSWDVRISLPYTNDSVLITDRLLVAWKSRNFAKPLMTGITFSDLAPVGAVTPSLFDPSIDRTGFNNAIDNMNQKFGKNTVFLAGLINAKDTASEKIAFNKTWLFSEGKGDNSLDD